MRGGIFNILFYIFQLFHSYPGIPLSWGGGGEGKMEDMFTLFGKLKMFPEMHSGAVVEELALNLRPKAQVIHSQAGYPWASHLPNPHLSSIN